MSSNSRKDATSTIDTGVTETEDDAGTTMKGTLAKVDELYALEKLEQVSQILRSFDEDSLEEKYLSMLRRAKDANDLVIDLKAKPENGGWTDQGIGKGEFPTRFLSRLEKGEKLVELVVRCETPIKKDLLIPMIAVLNETQLYKTWLPNFSVPRIHVRECEKLKQSGRFSQILYIVMDLPWPIASREIVLHASAFDNIDDYRRLGIKLKTIDTCDDAVVPKIDKNNVRAEVNGGFLFEKCPKDHPCMEFVERAEEGDEEEMVLVTFSVVLNPKMKYLPQSFLNFIVKTAFSTVWKIFLRIASDVKDGKRSEHISAIQSKREELYDYVTDRLGVMISAM